MQNNFVALLKKHTLIDENFIDTFFTKFRIGEELEFHIKDSDAAKYLGILTQTLRFRLQNKFGKGKFYFEKVDFIKIKHGRGRTLTYMINYPCFERLAMGGDTSQSEIIRSYFIKLREFLTTNHRVIYQAMENKELAKYSGFESIYFFAIDNRKHIFKIGHTMNILQRLRNYNIGRINEVDLKYFAIVKNRLLIEKCVKLVLKNNQILPNKEIYQVDPGALKKVIDECYCKYVNKAENDILYNELGSLIGLYAYTRNKVNIKPYIIIDTSF